MLTLISVLIKLILVWHVLGAVYIFLFWGLFGKLFAIDRTYIAHVAERPEQKDWASSRRTAAILKVLDGLNYGEAHGVMSFLFTVPILTFRNLYGLWVILFGLPDDDDLQPPNY